MAIGELYDVVIDCPDPNALAEFYRQIVGGEILDSDSEYQKALVIPSGMCAWCTFDWLINALVWLLGAFHSVFRDWGLAIICLVAIVRTCLHPITKRSQVHMMKMGKMGPEMERLKKK